MNSTIAFGTATPAAMLYPEALNMYKPRSVESLHSLWSSAHAALPNANVTAADNSVDLMSVFMGLSCESLRLLVRGAEIVLSLSVFWLERFGQTVGIIHARRMPSHPVSTE
jgi:hypothetical protein